MEALREGDDKVAQFLLASHEVLQGSCERQAGRAALPPGAKPEVTLLAGSHRFADVARK